MNRQEIEAILDGIPDPEIPVVSIRELGMLRDIRVNGDEVEVVITPTYSGCPAMEQIEQDIRAALAPHPVRARVTRQLAPAWSTDWIGPEAREKLRRFGIAPPQGTAAAPEQVIRFATKQGAARTHSSGAEASKHAVNCPRCGSASTVESAPFGSTACKSLWRCLDCKEPFDYFKPY